jgi:hypothetical protein
MASGASPLIQDHTVGSQMWPDAVPNKDVMGYRLPKAACPAYLLLTKGDPRGGPLTPREQQTYDAFVDYQTSRNPMGAPVQSDTVFSQTRQEAWYPHKHARCLLIYYMPWRKHHHDTAIGNYMTWSHHPSVKNAALVSACPRFDTNSVCVCVSVSSVRGRKQQRNELVGAAWKTYPSGSHMC